MTRLLSHLGRVRVEQTLTVMRVFSTNQIDHKYFDMLGSQGLMEKVAIK